MPDIPDRPTQPFVPRQTREIPPAMPGRLWDRRLYHGTRLNFNIGDRILPAEAAGVASNYGSEELINSGLRQHAFATWDITDAQHWASAGSATVPSGKRNIYLVSPINDAVDENGIYVDLDQDPYSETGIRSKAGFNIEGRFTEEGLENERATQAARKLVTNSMHDLRIDESGQAFFLHVSQNPIEVGDTVKTTNLKKIGTGMGGDALPGRSYAWDALNESSIFSAYKTYETPIGNAVSNNSFYIHITHADSSLVAPDLNASGFNEGFTGGGLNATFKGTNSRAIKRRTNCFRSNYH